MSQANVEIVQSIYSAFSRGDGPGAFAHMDPAIVWNEAENFCYSDRNPYVGSQAIGEGVFLRLATEWEEFRALPAEYVDGGETIVVFGRYRATCKATGKPLNAQFAHVWRLRAGLVTGFQQYTDTAQAMLATQSQQILK